MVKSLKTSTKVVRQIKISFNHCCDVSQRKAAIKLNHKFPRFLKNRLTSELIKNKKTKDDLSPNKTEKLKCRNLLDKYRGYNFIVDDENFFTLSNKDESIIYNILGQ